ncbi:hypothetical protein [Amycolatopsis sp. MEPSY49]|uniref:hypothetical protein n=1 Tax=Amycolatopsis sp. MEPSY49 TaxID=3151600 RepID=UPI003EF80822
MFRLVAQPGAGDCADHPERLARLVLSTCETPDSTWPTAGRLRPAEGDSPDAGDVPCLYQVLRAGSPSRGSRQVPSGVIAGTGGGRVPGRLRAPPARPGRRPAQDEPGQRRGVEEGVAAQHLAVLVEPQLVDCAEGQRLDPGQYAAGKELAERLVRSVADQNGRLVDALRRGVAAGKLRTVDPEDVATVLWASWRTGSWPADGASEVDAPPTAGQFDVGKVNAAAEALVCGHRVVTTLARV